MLRKVDCIIVGAGLAGTTLACQLINRGVSVLVIKGPQVSASRAAAGLFNPITGRHIVKTWKATELFPYLINFYQTLENKFNTRFLYSLPIYKPFGSFEEQNSFIAQSAENAYSGFLDTAVDHEKYSSYVFNDKGGFQTLHSGYVDVTLFLDTVHAWLKPQEALREDTLDVEDVEWKENGLRWKDIEASKIIFCEGVNSNKNALFSWVPVNPSKGEVMKVKIEHFTDEVAFNKQLFLIPVGNGEYKTGSTYYWKFEDEQPTEKGRLELSQRLSELIRHPFSIADHWAGIRPASRDRRPYLGIHPRYPQAYIFNGLGAKGVSLAPWFSEQMADFVINGKEPEPEVNITRLKSLYSHI